MNTYNAFGREIEVEHNGLSWHPYPWRFRIRDGNITHHYAGTPNQCETKLSAFRRAWWRCKWMSDGTYSERYI